MFYDRKIKYVDVFENEVKVQNAGFAKLEVNDEKVILQLQISKLRVTDSYQCPIVLISGTKEGRIGELTLDRGKGVWKSNALNRKNLISDIEYEQIREIHIKLPGDRMLRCIVSEDTEEESVVNQVKEQSSPEQAVSGQSIEEPKRTSAELQQESLSSDEFEKYEEAMSYPNDSDEISSQPKMDQYMQEKQEWTSELPVQRTGAVLASAGKWQQLLTIYPHIRPFEDIREYLMLKPGDLVVLPEKYFGLADNSFLLHGYFNYEHLIMSKENRGNKEVYYIGVPGNFYHKEKQVAILFGFESFEGKTEPAREGDFGYYMIPVEL